MKLLLLYVYLLFMVAGVYGAVEFDKKSVRYCYAILAVIAAIGFGVKCVKYFPNLNW